MCCTMCVVMWLLVCYIGNLSLIFISDLFFALCVLWIFVLYSLFNISKFHSTIYLFLCVFIKKILNPPLRVRHKEKWKCITLYSMFFLLYCIYAFKLNWSVISIQNPNPFTTKTDWKNWHMINDLYQRMLYDSGLDIESSR